MADLIEIRGDGANIALEIAEFERPNSANVDDANWLVGQLTITLKYFSCQMPISLGVLDLAQLQSELQSCLKILGGTARLRPLEPVLQLDLAFDRRGHVTVSGFAQTLGPRKTTLSFSFDSDQSYLTEADRQLRRVLLNFPIQNRPRRAVTEDMEH